MGSHAVAPAGRRVVPVRRSVRRDVDGAKSPTGLLAVRARGRSAWAARVFV